MTQNVESLPRGANPSVLERRNKAEKSAEDSARVPNPLTDTIDLSTEARARLTEDGQAALETIQQGLETLQQVDIDFARLRLAEVQTRLSFEGDAFSNVQVNQRELGNIASQIRTIIGIDFTAQNITLQELLESVDAASPEQTDIST